MINLQKMAGLSALSQALIYISAFIYFGAFWSFPQDASALEKMTYLAENQFVFSIMLFLMYAVFGVFLAVLVVGLHERLKHTNNPVMTIGTVFGLIWVGLVIASGMISNIGLAHAIDMMDANPEKAFEVWTIIALITESLGGGNELVGGLWVLLVSIAALQAQIFSRGLNYLVLLLVLPELLRFIQTKYSPNYLVFPKSFGLFGWGLPCLYQLKLTSKSNALSTRHIDFSQKNTAFIFLVTRIITD